jgi:hypothetical protein
MDSEAVAMFEIMIWAGAAVTLAGLAMLVWCIVRVARVRRKTTDEERLRDALQRVVPLNLAALFLSVAGLMLVVVGIILG